MNDSEKMELIKALIFNAYEHNLDKYSWENLVSAILLIIRFGEED